MVAYSFRPRFVEPIIAGTKRQTIRAVGKRCHAQPDEALQLYTGMRTKHCRLILRETCRGNLSVRLQLDEDLVTMGGDVIRKAEHLDTFGRADGFASWDELKAFWAQEHKGVDDFHGRAILW